MSQVSWVLSHFSWTSAADLILVALILYLFLRLIEGTRAVHLVRGILILVVLAALISTFSPFPVLNWIIRAVMPALVVAIPVIFQPELRRGLERLGRTPGLVNRPLSGHRPSLNRTLGEILAASERLSDRRYGGIVAMERTTGLQDFADTGVQLDAAVSADLLVSVFFPGSPLHDGAVIVRGDRVVSARSILPLSESLDVLSLGMRHRAALALAEQTDAVCFVVSEETGGISLAANGILHRNLNKLEVERLLTDFFGPLNIRPLRFRRRGRVQERTIPALEQRARVP